MKLFLCALAVVGMVALSGCVASYSGPVTGWLTVGEKGPVAVGDSAVPATKAGKAQAQGIILIAFGDASVSAAMKDAGITRISHVDCEVLNIIGIYSSYETTVYGE